MHLGLMFGVLKNPFMSNLGNVVPEWFKDIKLFRLTTAMKNIHLTPKKSWSDWVQNSSSTFEDSIFSGGGLKNRPPDDPDFPTPGGKLDPPPNFVFEATRCLVTFGLGIPPHETNWRKTRDPDHEMCGPPIRGEFTNLPHHRKSGLFFVILLQSAGEVSHKRSLHKNVVQGIGLNYAGRTKQKKEEDIKSWNEWRRIFFLTSIVILMTKISSRVLLGIKFQKTDEKFRVVGFLDFRIRTVNRLLSWIFKASVQVFPRLVKNPKKGARDFTTEDQFFVKNSFFGSPSPRPAQEASFSLFS